MVLAEGLGDEDCPEPWDKKAIVALARRLAVIMHRIWADGTEFSGPEKSQRHESRAGSNAIEDMSSTKQWNDVPRGTMDEVSSCGSLDLTSA